MSRFPFSKNQVIGAVVVCLLLILTFLLLRFMPCWYQQKPADTAFHAAPEQAIALQERLRERERRRYTDYRVVPQDTVVIRLQPFDPNTADSLTLLQLGLRPWMVKNMLKYRAAGGRFRSQEALRRVYGMTDTLYARLQPYIRIDTLAFRKDSLPVRQYTSIKKDTILDLNACDTTALQCIRGIGSYTARQIVRYRRELGGYVSVSQLREIPVLQDRADSLLASFVVTPDSVRPLRVNHTKADRLSRHPYLSFEQARAIYELRRMRFRLSSIDELRSLPCFNDSTLLRLQPYLSFEE